MHAPHPALCGSDYPLMLSLIGITIARLVGPDRSSVVVGQSRELDLLVAALTP